MTLPLRLPDFRVTKTTLANGLDVIARRQPHLPLVAVNLWYHVGSKNEERRQRGFAHLFEHLMFEGSEHYPGDFFKPLQRLGASINGSTSTDRTNYFEDVPSAHVELALAMESDRMGHLLPALDDAKLRIQKDVVKNEYRQNYANRPYGLVGQHLAEALYPPDHPYSWLTIGVMEDVEAATREDVEAFFRRYYVPSNASLCLVGDIDEDRALALAERYFGPIAGGAKALPPRAPTPRLDRDVEIPLHDRVELDRVYLAWPTVPHFHDDEAALVLLADLLARGKSSRLYRRLVVARELAQDVTAYQSGRELAGSFGVQVTLRPGRSRDLARALIDAELAAIAESGVTDRGAGAGPERPARRLLLRARQHRRVRRRGRPAQRLQHVPRRPGADHLRLRAVSGGHARRRPRRGAALPGRGAPGGADSPGPQGVVAAGGGPARSLGHPAECPGGAVPGPLARDEDPALRAAALGHPPPRPADRRGHVRPGRRRGATGARPGRPGATDRLDDGRGDHLTVVVRSGPRSRGDGYQPLDQLRLGRLVRRLPVPDASPRARASTWRWTSSATRRSPPRSGSGSTARPWPR